jgi:hypothetical protein
MLSLRSLSYLALALAAAACSRDELPTGLAGSLLSDRSGPGVQSVPGFYFLPPLAPVQQYGGVFDGTLAPVVEVFQASGALVARFTTQGAGASAVRVDQTEQQYIVNWHDDGGTPHLVRVLVQGRQLGQAALTAGRRTWPIKFRIEVGALPNFALDFSNSYVEVPDAPSLDLSSAWTLEAWIYPRHVEAPDFQHVISKWDGGGNASYTLEVHAGRLRVGLHDGVHPTDAVESVGLLANNTWQHVAATFDHGTVRLYINGVLDRTVNGLVTPMNSDRPLSFGHEGPPYGGWWYDGLIDEVRVWNVVRTDAQLLATMGQRLSGSELGLVGYWPFDEGTGDVAHDATANGNNGRLGSGTGPDPNDPTWTTNAAPIQ